MRKYLKLARVHQYVKNIFIIAPLFFSGHITDMSKLLPCLLGVLCFGFISSVIYIINDIKDVHFDKLHPKKCLRPIASGAISVKKAIAFAVVLFVLAVVFSAVLFIKTPYSALYAGVYFVLNLLYTYKLKNIPIVDIAILAAGFMIRLLYGATIIDIQVSNWLYLTVMSISFFLAIGKRRNELKNVDSSGATRKSLQMYNFGFLDKILYMFAALTIVFYSLWCINSIMISRGISDMMLWSVPGVIILVTRYCFIMEGSSDGDPTDALLHDMPMCIMGVLYAIYTAVVLYVI